MQISRLIKLLRVEEMYHSSVVHHIRLLPAWFSPGDEFADSGATDELGQKCNQMGMSAPDTCHKEKPKLFHKSTQNITTHIFLCKKIARGRKLKWNCDIHPIHLIKPEWFSTIWICFGQWIQCLGWQQSLIFPLLRRDLVINFFYFTLPIVHICRSVGAVFCISSNGSSSSRAMNAFCIC